MSNGADGSEIDAAPDDPIVRRVRALLALAVQHRVAELTLEAGDFKMSVRAQETDHRAATASTVSRSPAVEPTTSEMSAPTFQVITAPMIGTFYTAPAPGEPPFVAQGDQIEPGQTIAIIEAMKIMNEIQSDQSGILVEVLARSGQGVEFGQPLFHLLPK